MSFVSQLAIGVLETGPVGGGVATTTRLVLVGVDEADGDAGSRRAPRTANNLRSVSIRESVPVDGVAVAVETGADGDATTEP